MNVFRLWSKRDPMVAVLKPFVDPRIWETNPNIGRICDQRVAENKARRAERKKVDAIAREYA